MLVQQVSIFKSCCLTADRVAGSMHRGYAIACDTKLNVPKIALMFLARGGMPLSKVWEAWLQPIAGLMPMQVSVLAISDDIGQSLQHSNGFCAAVAICYLRNQGLLTLWP